MHQRHDTHTSSWCRCINTNLKAVGAWHNKLSNNELSLAKTADVFYSHLEMSKLEELKGQHITTLLINL